MNLRLIIGFVTGPLLGIVRDKELLDWDNDIDIAVIEDEVNKNKIISEFLSNGFELKKILRK